MYWESPILILGMSGCVILDIPRGKNDYKTICIKLFVNSGGVPRPNIKIILRFS